jgi:hypothetical protein
MRTLAMLALACGAMACLGLLSPTAGPRGSGLGGQGASGHGASAAATAEEEPKITVQSPLVVALKDIEKAQEAIERGDNQAALSALAEAKTLIELQINAPTSPGPTDEEDPTAAPPADSRFMVITMPAPRRDDGRAN